MRDDSADGTDGRDETMPREARAADQDDGEGSSLDAGLRAAFGDGAGAPVGEGGASVLGVLGERTAAVSRVSLRELEEEHSPVYRPLTPGGAALPDRLGRYQVAGEIAQGGIGAVYKARDVDLGRDVALKVLLEAHRGKAEMVQRFLEEAQIGGQLQHPGILPVHELGLVGGERPYFAMKLVKGKTLSRLLDDRPDPAAGRQRFVSIFEQICQPIAYAHARGVIHRDLKPSNVMVGAFGEVQVMDWGLAKVLARGGVADERPRSDASKAVSVIHTVRSGSTGSDSLAGSVLGTPAYMCPEQARGEVDRLDERADVFGLGAILCEILTGRPPYVAASVKDVHRAAQNGDLEDAFGRIDGCGADVELVELAKRCLAFEPRDRPRDAGQVARSVRSYLDSLEARARALEVEAAEERVRARGERRARKLTAGLAAAVVVAVVAVAGGFLWVETERRARRAAVVGAFDEAIAEALEKRAGARANPSSDPKPWDEALDATGRAAAAAVDVDELRVRAERLAAEIDRESRGHRLRARLEEIVQEAGSRTSSAIAQSVRQALKTFLGADLLALERDGAIELIRESGLAAEVAPALVDWAWSLRRQAVELRRTLLDIALEVDPDPWRRRALRAFLDRDPEEIRRLAEESRSTELSIADIRLLLVGLMSTGQAAAGERFLRDALERHPQEWWLNAALGELLFSVEPRRREEGLRYTIAAVARAPRSPYGWDTLGGVYADLEDFDAALDAYSRGGTLRPGHRDPHAPVLALLLRHEDWGPALERFVRRYEKLAASGRLVDARVRDAIALGRARLAAASGDIAGAVQELERAASFPDSPTDVSDLIEEYRARLRPAPLSLASIDAVLDAAGTLVPVGARWRYFPGTGAPSEGLEWTLPEFDDGAWPEGESGFGYGDGDDRTVLDDMEGSYTTVFIRHRFTVGESPGVASLLLSVLADDGFVAYLNGTEVGRFGVPDGVVAVPHDATSDIGVQNARTHEVEISPDHLRAGTNILAVVGLNSAPTSSDFSLEPVLEAVLERAAVVERGRRLLETLAGADSGEGSPARRPYLEARLHELEGKTADTVERLRAAVRVDPAAFEARRRLAEMLLADPSAAVAREVRGLLLAGDGRYAPLWTRWAAVSFARLRRSPRELLAELPPALEDARAAPRRVDELRWLLELLSAGAAVRINCGDETFEDAAGRTWARDRFFLGGSISNARAAGWLVTEIDGTEDDLLYAEGRYFRPEGPASPGYRVPLPPARYRVTLHFCENYYARPAARVFDVLLESETVIDGLDVFAAVGFATPDPRSFEVEVADGLLELEFNHRVENPRIAAIEIEAAPGGR